MKLPVIARKSIEIKYSFGKLRVFELTPNDLATMGEIQSMVDNAQKGELEDSQTIAMLQSAIAWISGMIDADETEEEINKWVNTLSFKQVMEVTQGIYSNLEKFAMADLSPAVKKKIESQQAKKN